MPPREMDCWFIFYQRTDRDAHETPAKIWLVRKEGPGWLNIIYSNQYNGTRIPYNIATCARRAKMHPTDTLHLPMPNSLLLNQTNSSRMLPWHSHFPYSSK